MFDEIQVMLNMPEFCDGRHYYRVAVAGGVHAGKTTLLRNLSEYLCLKGYKMGGFIEEAVFEGNRRIGYDFVDVQTGEKCRIAQRKPSGIGYDFLDEAWMWAKNHIHCKADVMIVDELGLLEAEGMGMMPFLLEALESRRFHLIASVRWDVLGQIEAKIGKFDKVIRVEDAA